MAFTTRVNALGALQRPAFYAPQRRVAWVARAETQDQQQSEFFKSNKLANRGYLEEDSAGQENIFAVQPKKYIQGSEVDETTGNAGNTFFGVAGAALGLVVIAAGTGALFVQDKTKDTYTFDGDFSGLSTLGQYEAKFSAEIRQPAPSEAPAVSSEI